MSYAFGHLVGAWAAGKIYEYVSKHKISPLGWFFLLLGGILPDIDFLLDWTLGYDTHRTLTHSLFFLGLVPIVIYLSSYLFNQKQKDKKEFALLIGLGIVMHLFLDSLFGAGIPLLWPSLLHFSFTQGIQYLSPQGSAFTQGASEIGHQLRLTIVDMAIGTAWIFYLWFKRRITF
jgi:membrane-bound metal-dependent hydrolase YbcI (DUF457 family)